MPPSQKPCDPSFPGGPHRGASKLASGQGQGLRQDSTHRCHNGAAPGPTPARRLGPLHRDWHWQWARPAHGLPAVSRVTGPPLHRPLRFGAAVAFSSRQAVDCMARRRAVVSLRKFPSVRFGLPVELTEIRVIKFRQTRKSPARRIGTPIPGPGRIGNRGFPVSRRNRESGIPSPIPGKKSGNRGNRESDFLSNEYQLQWTH